MSERKIERKINIDSEHFRSSEVLFTYSIGADAEFAAILQGNICRVYPAGYRIDSSNFNPTMCWSLGVHGVST